MQSVLSLPGIIISLFILALLSFFFSASETSIIGLSRIRLRHMVNQGLRRAHSVQRVISKLDQFIAAILVLNNFVNIAISAVASAICIAIFGYQWGIIIATLITVFFVVILCEITPKVLAIKHTERIALFVSPFMEAILRIFAPLIAVFSGVSNLLIKSLGIKSVKRSPLITEEELRLMIEIGREEGFVSDSAGNMLQQIFKFGDTRVRDVMVLKKDMVAVDINMTPEDLLNTFVERGHARLPVFRNSIDTIAGIIYAHDLLYILRDKGLFVLQDLVHEACYIPADLPVNELLSKFQKEKIQIAVVVDEHGKTLGLVTLEDLIEEIVGELEEKHTKVRHKQ